MKNDLVLVNPKEFGIEENKATELIGNLPQLQNERNALEKQYNEVIKMDIESHETTKLARELRLKIRDNRTKGINVWHKTTKDVFLRAGQFIDALKNKEIAVNERMESNLEEIEKYAENKELERIELLRKERSNELEIYSEFVPFGIDLGALSDNDYINLLNGAKLQLNAKIEAEKQAEKERIEAEKIELARIEEEKRIEAEKIEAQRLENERLKLEAQKREAELKIEREKQAKLEAELNSKREAELKIEREKQAKLEAEKKELEKLAKKPIQDQLKNWINSINIEIPENLKENLTANDINEKFNSFKKWALTSIENN
jgi:hypothetical protein